MHKACSFNTLTYSDEHLPADYGVHVRPLQLFMKKARKRIPNLRFFAVGEYGDQNFRPHYHVLLFGTDFAEDRYLWRVGAGNTLNYRSPTLESLWPWGHCETATLNPDNAGYAARYMVKKINGDMAKEHYTRVHPLTGQIAQVRPEFITMSTHPGIGHDFYQKYKSDVFPSDFMVIQGEKVSIPRYYFRLFARANDREELAPSSLPSEKIRLTRIQDASERHRQNPLERSFERLATKEEVLRLKASRLKRPLEEPEQ